MKNKTLIITCIALLITIIGITCFSNAKIKQLKAENAVNELLIDRLAETTTVTDTSYKTIYLVDTVVKPVIINKLSVDTVFVHNTDGTEVRKELHLNTVTYNDSVINDNDTIKYQLQITGRSYEDEELPRLDYFKAVGRVKTIETVKYTTVMEKSRQNQSKLVFVPNIGVGYGLIGRQPDIYIGIGIGYQLK